MPNRKRRQARDMKYARFDEHRVGDRQPPQPFLAPALEITVDRFTPALEPLIDDLSDQSLRKQLGRKTLPW
jgi:hypothetical protein